MSYVCLLSFQKFLLLPSLSFLIKVSLKKKINLTLPVYQEKEIYSDLDLWSGRPGIKPQPPSKPDLPKGVNRGREAKHQVHETGVECLRQVLLGGPHSPVGGWVQGAQRILFHVDILRGGGQEEARAWARAWTDTWPVSGCVRFLLSCNKLSQI